VSRSYVMFYVDVAHWSPIMMGKLAQWSYWISTK
jgi:hypothetical protein